MANEIVDPTNSPPSPPRTSSNAPNLLNFGDSSSANVQLQNSPMPLWSNMNPTYYHQNALWPTSSHIYEPFHFPFGFQPSMNDDRVFTVLEPVPEAKAFLFPHGVRFKEPWTEKEHELFLMGLIRFGKGHWSEIAKYFLLNKTPQQVQNYAASFYRHLPATYLYGFRRRRHTNFYDNSLMVRNMNPMEAPAPTPYYCPVVLNEPPKTLTLFPEKTPLFPISPFEEGGSGNASGSNNNTINYGSQMLRSDASISLTASDNEDIDLELRLG